MLRWFKRKLSRRSPIEKASPAKSVLKSCEIESLESRSLLSGSLQYGINANNINASSYGGVLSALRDTGTKTIRMWLTVRSYGDRSTPFIIPFVKKFAAAGIDVTLDVVPNGNLTNAPYDTVKSYFNWLVSMPGVASAVGRWQIGNEPDYTKGTWHGTLAQYTTNLLKPAAAALHTHGELVVAAGVTMDPSHIQAMVDAGALSYTDFFAYHAYRNSLSDLVSKIAQAKAAAHGRPLIITEWNAPGSTGAAWAAKVKQFWPVIRANSYAAYFYPGIVASGFSGATGIITKTGAHRDPYYSTYKSLSGGFSGTPIPTVTASSGSGQTSTTAKAPVTAPVSTPTSKPTTTGNTAASQPKASEPATPTPVTAPVTTVSKPIVYGFAIVNAATGKVIAGYSDITASTKIKLSALPTLNIKIVGIVSHNTGSVMFHFSGQARHIENYAPYNVFDNPWKAHKGTFTLSAEAYRNDNATGQVGVGKSVQLSFV